MGTTGLYILILGPCWDLEFPGERFRIPTAEILVQRVWDRAQGWGFLKGSTGDSCVHPGLKNSALKSPCPLSPSLFPFCLLLLGLWVGRLELGEEFSSNLSSEELMGTGRYATHRTWKIPIVLASFLPCSDLSGWQSSTFKCSTCSCRKFEKN